MKNNPKLTKAAGALSPGSIFSKIASQVSTSSPKSPFTGAAGAPRSIPKSPFTEAAGHVVRKRPFKQAKIRVILDGS